MKTPAKEALRNHLAYYLTPVLLVCMDLDLFYLVFHAAVKGTEAAIGGMLHIPPPWFLLLPLLHVCCLWIQDVYRARRVFYECARHIIKASSFAVLFAILIDYLIHPFDSMFPPGLFALYWVLSLTLDCVAHYVARTILRQFGIWKSSVILVGAGKTAQRFVKAFGDDYLILGLVEDDASRPLLKKYPHLGRFEEIESIVQRYLANEVVLATPGLSRHEQVELFYRIQPYAKKVSLIPDLFDIPIGNVQIENSLDDRLLVIKTKNNLNSKGNRLIKRVFDLVMGLIIAVCITPFLLFIAVLIKMDSNGPICYNADRIGKGGGTFRCYKFRSMYMDADRILLDFLDKHPAAEEEWKEFQKLRGDDPRVTKVGRIIRKYSLDELPQIFNVIKGEMSLVGPRPYLPREKKKMGEFLPVICMTTPGITGLWQVSGRSNIKFNGRLRLDAWYVRNWNLWQDVILLVKTAKVLFFHSGAY